MSGDGLIWVLLHGLGDDGAGFETLQRRLEANGRDVVRPDIHRIRAAAFGTLEAVAWEIHSQLVGGREFIAVGHSLGALIATCMVAGNDRAKGIVAIEGSFSTRDARAVAAFAEPGGRLRLVEYLGTGSASDSPVSYRASVELVEDEPFLGLARAVVERGTELGKTFFQLQVPKLCLVGERAGAKGLSEHDLGGAPPTLDVHVVNKAGHWPHCDSPDEVADTIERWVARRLAPR